MSTNPRIPELGDRVRVTGTQVHRGVAGTVTDLEPDVHYDGSPAVTVTLVNGERVWGHTSRFTSDPLPSNATWSDYVTANGGPERSGWWVTLRWFADSVHARPEVVGPYSSHEEAVAAMEDSLLITGIAEDTDRTEVLDDVYVATDPASIARMCADYGHRVTLIDPGDPSHFGGTDPEPTVGVPSAAGAVTARSGLLQAGALHTPDPDAAPRAVDGISDGVDRSPGPPSM